MPSKPATELPPTPDFDSYPVSARIVEVSPEDDGRVLQLAWCDGRQSRFHAIWLRDNASDEENLNLETREQRSDITALPEGVRIAEARVDGAGALEIAWTIGAARSRFHPGWLYAHDYSNEGLEDVAAIEPLPWDAATLSEPPSFDGAAILEDDQVLEDWLQAVCRHGIARLHDVPAKPNMVARVAERIGPVRSTNFGHIFDVRVQRGPGSNAYSTLALTPHTDLPTREYQPGLQFLHCLRNTSLGGQAVMVDGISLVETIRAQDPKAYESLTTIDWPCNNRAVDTDYRWRAPIVRLDPQGRLDELRVSPFLRAPLDLPFDQVEEAYRSLRVFFEAIGDPSLQMRFDYRPGDLLLFDNRRILHGRDAYQEGSNANGDGERWLQGCYGEREELQSRLRILARKRRAEKSETHN